MRSPVQRALAALGLGAAMLLAACGGGGNNDGTLRLWLTDAPACGYDEVNVTIEKIRVHQSASAGENDAGWSEIVLSPPKRLDLLDLTNGVLADLGQTPLPAGKYTQMRLVLAANGGSDPLANSVVPTGGSEVALDTPSGQQSGLKMNVNIDIAENRMADFVLDFDACKSVVKAGASGKYLLKPVVRVTPHYISGVSGAVASALAGAAISVQQDGVVVKSTIAAADGKFLLQPVAPGTYDLVVVAPGRATAVVTGVVVASETVTAFGGAFDPPASDSGGAIGVVTTGTTPVDAFVAAKQDLTGGTTIEVASGPVDATTGAYALALPTGAPLVAAWTATLLDFAADDDAAGQYTLAATSGGTTKTVGPVALTAGADVTTDFAFP